MGGITGFDRAKELHIQKIMIGRMVGKYRAGFQREIVSAMRQAAVDVSRGGDGDDIRAQHEQNLARMLDSLWRESGNMMGSRVYNASNAKHGRFNLLVKAEDPVQPWMSALLGWIAGRSGVKVKQISDTTVKQVREFVRRGVANGDGLEDIAESIRDNSAVIGGSRSQTIARTEVHNAAMYGSYEGAMATGFDMVKEWIASNDGATREEHNAVDGEQVEMNDYFYVGDSQLLHPGGDGEPADVINCRCGIAYNTV